MAIKQISERAYIMEEHQALVTFPDLETQAEDGKEIKIPSPKYPGKIWSWGEMNTLPEEREKLIRDNNIVGQLLKTQRDIMLGNGLIAYKSRYEETKDGMREIKDFMDIPSYASEFFDRSQIDKQLNLASKNYNIHANIFWEFIMNKGARVDDGKVDSIAVKECRHVRAEKMDSKGIINNYYWCGKWSNKKEKDFEITQIPSYKAVQEKPKGKFIYHTGDNLLTDDYYFSPAWWGSRSWIALANTIPVFHLNNLENGYSIRFHIEVPKDYFRDYASIHTAPIDDEEAMEKEDKARQDFLDKVNNFLAGIKNSGRALFTEYDLSADRTKELGGIKITPIKYDMKDEALLKLFEKSNQAVISAQGVHPTLAAIETQGKLSSGSEIRNAFLMYVAIKTPQSRATILEAINMVKKMNGWDPEIKYTFKDIQITKLDDNKDGNQEVNVTNGQ